MKMILNCLGLIAFTSVSLVAMAEDVSTNHLKHTVVSCSSSQSEHGPNSSGNAVDGDPETIWHTAFRPKAKSHPHEIVIDLGQSKPLTGFFYTPRSEGLNGTIQNYVVYLGDKAGDWGQPVAKGIFFEFGSNTYTQRRVEFEKTMSGRYLRLVALSSVNGEPFTSAAEIGVFTGAFQPTPQPAVKAICFALYTTQNHLLKMTAQLYPDQVEESETVVVEVQRDDRWVQIAQSTAVLPGWTVHFRVENWDTTKAVPYRVRVGQDVYEGVVREDPIDKDQVVAAVFTGNSSYPWGGGRISKQDIVDNVNKVDPDVLLFTGDQVYIHNNHTVHWIKFGQTFGDLIRSRPTVCIPDDHDVGQPNLWGGGGRKTDLDTKGGYTKPIEYVNMVQRQQTWHLPDPFDPTPIQQGMTVYYTRLNVGGIDMAIIEDRKFKSGCYDFQVHKKGLGSRPDHIEKPDYDPADYDLPGLKLLGDRQLKFLDQWSRNWDGAVMKAVVSQTVFAQTSTNHGPRDTFYYVDFDANGWPQAGRDKALRIMQRCAAFHICGDQHLATMGQYGIDEFRDASWWFCVPSISNTYPRRWAPKHPAVKPLNNGMEYTGDYYDTMKNRMTIYAHTNPRPTTREPVELHERMPGFGIVRFSKSNRTITMECWPRMTDPTDPTSKQYQGWPHTIRIDDPRTGK